MANKEKLLELREWVVRSHKRLEEDNTVAHFQHQWFVNPESTTGQTFIKTTFLKGLDPDKEVKWCGTPCCAAGHVALMAGAVPDFNGSGDQWTTDHVIGTDGERYLVPAFAERELDLTPDQSNELFEGSLQWDEVVDVIDRILEEAL